MLAPANLGRVYSLHHWRSPGALLFCADGAHSSANDTGTILTRTEAARYLRISVRAFDMHVRGRVPEHRIGRKPLFRKADLESWLDLQKVGGFGSGATGTSYDSPMLVNASSSPRLRRRLRTDPFRGRLLIHPEGLGAAG
jgi:excisionase family DNA binding protein